MYPELQYIYRTSDGIIHTTPEGARAQARHLPEPSLEKITCKTLKSTYLKS